MITIPNLIIEPGGEYYFPADDITQISTFSAGDWSGTAIDMNIFDSDDSPTPATIIAPAGVTVSYATFSNINNTGSPIIADYTCIDGGGNSGILFSIRAFPDTAICAANCFSAYVALATVMPASSILEFYTSPYYEVTAGGIANWDAGDDMPDQWIRKCDGQDYSNERELYRNLLTESYNRFGVCMTFYVLSYDTQYDKIYGEDNDRRFVRKFDIMAYFPLQTEEKLWTKFAVHGVDEFSLFVSKDHFREASTYGDTQVSGNVGPNTYPVYIPKTGDVIQSQYNGYLYEIANVKEEAMMIHLNKRYVWEFVVRPFTDEHLSLDPVTSAAMSEVAKFIDVKPDIFDVHNEAISAAAAVAYVPKSCERPPRDPFGGW